MTAKITPPDSCRNRLSDAPESPSPRDRGFLVGEVPDACLDARWYLAGSTALQLALTRGDGDQALSSFQPNPAFDEYLRMEKVIATKDMATPLEHIFNQLMPERMPRYLLAAGSAAVETALVRTDRALRQRLQMLKQGTSCWRQALENQTYFNRKGPECLVEHSAPHRIALRLATLPLVEGIIGGRVSREACRQVQADGLAIAQLNLAPMLSHDRRGDIEASKDHAGFSHELISLLGYNRQISPHSFMLPASYRADTGQYLSAQTHDMMVLSHQGGKVTTALPTEIKGIGLAKQRRRYTALLISGRDHLSVREPTDHVAALQALTADFFGDADPDQRLRAQALTESLVGLVSRYSQAEILEANNAGSVMKFRRQGHLSPSLQPVG